MDSILGVHDAWVDFLVISRSSAAVQCCHTVVVGSCCHIFACSHCRSHGSREHSDVEFKLMWDVRGGGTGPGQAGVWTILGCSEGS
eukprot:4447933-Amphidinium_carterae.2